MRIAILGPLEVHTGPGAPVEVSGARLRRLLVLLALEAGRVVAAGQLVEGIWGDEPPAAPGNALQAIVSRLRRAVPQARIESHPNGYRLVIAPDAVDVTRFEQLVTAGRARLPADPTGAIEILTEALALWRGPALTDLADTGPARGPIARLSELRLTAIEERIEAQLMRGESASLVPELRALVAAHPVRERVAGQLMRALRAAGQPAEALASYERIRVALADGLGADPCAELAALHLELLRPPPAGVRPSPAAPPTGGTAPTAGGGPLARHNLPAVLTSFFGREEELRRVGKLLAEARLVTLTGPGGAGKTRLALESARSLLGRTPDGVWLAELAPVTDAAEIPQTLLAALGLREHALLPGASRASPAEPSDPVGRLVGALATRDVLLILDNCEHLVAGAASVAERLLTACPRLRVLATSREPLGITGEVLHPVESLALPPPDAGAALAMTYPAVRLLADRAAAARPDFRVSEENVPPVIRICRALDGMPLAIELAAARLRAMSPAQVSARLDDRFGLLTGGSRTARPRHQTLRAMVDWSWELTDGGERAVWRRLAVFAGGATLESVERVCAGGGLDPAEVLDRLAALVDKSLVTTSPEAEPRYRMLETIREYGLRRLAEAGEADDVRRAHAREFLALAEAADPELRGRDQLRWFDRLAAEHDNLHAALRWAIGAGEPALAVRLTGALGWYWWLSGHRIEGAELAEQALGLPGADAVQEPYAVLAYGFGALNIAAARTDGERAMAWMLHGARLAERYPGAHPMLRLIGPLADSLCDRSSTAPLAGLAALYDDPDAWTAGAARLFHAQYELNLGVDPERAQGDMFAALELFRGIGERWGTAFTLTCLADLFSRGGQHAHAAELQSEALDALRAMSSAEDVPEIRIRLARELWRLGEADRATALLAESECEAVQAGLHEVQAGVHYECADILRAQGDWVAARQRLERATELEARSAPQWHAMIASSLGCVAAALGDPDAAREHHERALSLALESYDAPIVGLVLVGYADLALRTDRPGPAATLLGAADVVRGGPDRSLLDVPRIERAARERLGEAGFAEASARGRGTTMSNVRELVRLTLGE